MGDTVEWCDQGVHQGGEGRMQVLERHGHGTQDDKHVSNAEKDHQMIEDIVQWSNNNQLYLYISIKYISYETGLQGGSGSIVPGKETIDKKRYIMYAVCCYMNRNKIILHKKYE